MYIILPILKYITFFVFSICLNFHIIFMSSCFINETKILNDRSFYLFKITDLIPRNPFIYVSCKFNGYFYTTLR